MSKNKKGQKITGKQASKEAYIPLHEFLMFDENYRKLSSNAKILYTFLRNKITYFRSITEEAEMTGEGTRSYRDDEGYIFCIADNTELCFILNVAESTLIRIKKELSTFGLLTEVKIKDKANRIYVLDPTDLQERWEYINAINELRKEKKVTNQKKAQKHQEKQKNQGNLQNESYGNLQNEGYGNLQNEGYGNLQNESKLKPNLSELELNLLELESNISKLKPKYLSIYNEVDNSNLYDTTKIVIGKNIEGLTEDKLNIILELFEIYKSEITEVQFNAVISRVLKSKVQSSFRGFLEKSIKTETSGQPKNQTNTNEPVRKEMIPKWMEERVREDNEKSSMEVMNESKLNELKERVLIIAREEGKNIDVNSITLDNYSRSGTYLDMGFKWESIALIFENN
ncbi:replication initiator protein A [Bacillus pseudomycoides]|uniref:replication initiator protein A n=1 Tax=Bacillus pseudomycoides TaxID=64104 RepID=UPI000BFA571A|nr:replication initiator protein A [Bacillus pseudomycoides]PGA57344.1 hypothetical protein COL84_26625 [Bacillus pseudomycoides]